MMRNASVTERVVDLQVSDRLRFLCGVVFVAVGAATFAVAFRTSLTLVYRSVYRADSVVDAMTGLKPWLRFVVPLASAAIAGMIARVRAAPAQGVSNVMEAVALGNVRLSLRTTASRVASSWVAIAGGMSIGREGPLIEFGGALGAAIARVLATSLSSHARPGGRWDGSRVRRGLQHALCRCVVRP